MCAAHMRSRSIASLRPDTSVSQGRGKTFAAQLEASQLSEDHGILSAGEGSARWTRTGRGGIRKLDCCLLSLSQSQEFEVSKDSAEDRIYPEDPLS
jgi:hypothetical protein